MAYPQTLVDLQNEVLSRLSLDSASHAGDLPTGTGGSPTITTAATITQYLNEAAEQICRTCYPITDTGTKASFASNYCPFSSLTVSSGQALWAARAVKHGTNALTYCSRSALETNLGPVGLETAGTPLYWFPQGNDGVGVYPQPATPATLTVIGLAVPARLTGSAVPTWIEPDLAKALVYRAACLIAEKNTQNPQMAARIPVWMGEFEAITQDLLVRLWQSDPALGAAHFPKPSK